jgi:hypothetical protein
MFANLVPSDSVRGKSLLPWLHGFVELNHTGDTDVHLIIPDCYWVTKCLTEVAI